MPSCDEATPDNIALDAGEEKQKAYLVRFQRLMEKNGWLQRCLQQGIMRLSFQVSADLGHLARKPAHSGTANRLDPSLVGVSPVQVEERVL